MAAGQNPRRNRALALTLAGVMGGMLGLSFAAVPLYRLFCQVTGYGGIPRIDASASPGMVDRKITIRFNADVGQSARMHTSAIGKAILGVLDDDALRETIAGLTLQRMTRASLTNPKELFNDIRESAKRGYHTTAGENVDDVMGIGACVLVGDEPFAIAIAGPIQRMSELREEHARKLLKACKRISALQSRALDGEPADG